MATDAHRSAYRSIFLTRDDTPQDRSVWAGATNAQRLKASDQVHLDTKGANRYRLAWGL